MLMGWPPEPGLFLGLWLVLLVAGRGRLFQDPGVFWHTALGQQFLATGQLTRADSWTFTFHGQPWLSSQWLGDCLMAMGYGLGGWDTLLLGTAAMLAGLYTWIGSRLMRSGLHWLPSVAIVVVVIAASSHHFHVRPHLATLVLLGVLFARLCDVESGRARLASLLWLIPLIVIWSNLHGGVVGGLATIGFVAMGWGGLWLMRKQSPVTGARHAAMLVGLLLTLGLATLVNPYGLQMPQAWLSIMSLPLQEVIQEHRPLNWFRPEGAMVALLGLGYLWLLKDTVLKDTALQDAALKGTALGDTAIGDTALKDTARVRLRIVWLLPLVWFVLAALRVRHAPLFAVTTALAMADMLPHSRFARWLAARDFFSPRPPQRSTVGATDFKPALIPLAVLLLSLSAQIVKAPIPVIGYRWARLDPAQWPVDLLLDLRQLQASRVQEPRIFNALEFGGFLTFHTPRIKTFIDDRCELFGEFLFEYVEAERRDPAKIDAWADQYRFHAALARTDSTLDRYLQSSDRWLRVRRTEAATLYRPSGKEFSPTVISKR